MMNLILACINGFCAMYLVWSASKTWKHLPTGLRVLNVAVVVANVLCCAMNVLRALS